MTKSIDTLRKEAQSSTTAKGHRMQWGPIRPKTERFGRNGQVIYSKEKRQIGVCGDCGKEVTLYTHPAPNGIGIGGEAVALGCND